MFQKLIIVGISSLSLATFAKAPATYSQVRTELQKVSQKEIVFLVNSIVSNSLPSRMVGKPGHEKTRSYLLETIQKFDPKNSGKISSVSFVPDMTEVKSFYQKDFDTKIKGKSRNRLILGFDKFTIPDDKVFEIEIYERNGGRHIKLAVLNEYILSAEPLYKPRP